MVVVDDLVEDEETMDDFHAGHCSSVQVHVLQETVLESRTALMVVDVT